jgi:VIT1/CCC1 family predicted Fe2+/Mn2+ transporter
MTRAAGQAIFGASDGLMSILGPVMFTASRYPRLVFPVALMGAVSASASMAAGEHMSEDRTDYAAAAVMGAATFAGSVLPAAPWLAVSGTAAVCWSAAVCAAVALAVGRMRSWRRHRYLETAAILAGVAGLTVACNLLIPAGGG